MRIPWCFFSHWTTPSRSHGDFFRQRNWGYWVTWKNREMSPKCAPYSQGGSSDLWNYSKLWFMRLQENPTNWWWDSVVFLGFSVFFSGFFCAHPSCGVWHPRSPGGALPCGKFGREAGPGEKQSWVQGTWQIPCTNHTSNPFPVLFFFPKLYIWLYMCI